MSDLPSDYRERLDLRQEIGRIDRDRADTQKLQAESHKLQAENFKFMGEQTKLNAEAAKLVWDRRLSPYIILASLLSGGVVAVISHLWK